jgi:nucleotide-binding universal stress UspA family protein
MGLPTDGSDGTRGAVEHVIDLATTHDAAPQTISVVDETLGVDASVAGVLDTLEAIGGNALYDVLQQAAVAGVDTIEGAVPQGAPHRAILESVDEHDTDLAATWTHGRTSLDGYLFGSVTQKFARLSAGPVSTVCMLPGSADGELQRGTHRPTDWDTTW